MDAEIFFNGINGDSGDYLCSPLSIEQLSSIAQELTIDQKALTELKWRSNQERILGRLALEEGFNPKVLAKAGWGVLFPESMPPQRLSEIKRALQPLLEYRQAQAAKEFEGLYREFSGADGYRSGEDKFDFLERHGAGPGPVNPNQIPYYLLLIGSPEDIPFEFQYQLDIQYAVGRIYFDNCSDYAEYAKNVLLGESPDLVKGRVAAFVGTSHFEDPSTTLSSQQLIIPLAKRMEKETIDWKIETYVSDRACKETFRQLLGGQHCPAIFFSATHGIGFNSGDLRQFSTQGALICQEWPGRSQWSGTIPSTFYFAADDVSDKACMLGSVIFHFACYSGGTPALDEFGSDQMPYRRTLAPRPFIARLPTKILSQPGGGALAVVAHIDRAWGYSFLWEPGLSQIGVFASMLKRLIDGHPLGSAMEPFSSRYSELAADLGSELKALRRGKLINHKRLASLWTAQSDARSYIVLGDPAITLGLSSSF
jgi:hypothetical protein